LSRRVMVAFHYLLASASSTDRQRVSGFTSNFSIPDLFSLQSPPAWIHLGYISKLQARPVKYPGHGPMASSRTPPVCRTLAYFREKLRIQLREGKGSGGCFLDVNIIFLPPSIPNWLKDLICECQDFHAFWTVSLAYERGGCT
jgi:hypothetical protein